MEAPHTPAEVTPHTFTINVVQANRLQGRKADFQSFVRVEVDGTVLGESEKKKHKDGTDNSFHYDYSCNYQCSREPHAVSDLSRKLIIVTVSDFLPEEKKADAKSTLLGQAVVDLLPFLHGLTKYTARVSLQSAAPLPNKNPEPTKTQSQSSMSAEVSRENELARKVLLKWRKPSLDIVVSVSEPVLGKDALSVSNLMKVTVETAFSVPDAWTLPSGSSPTATSYTAALELPLTAQKNQIVAFMDGALKAGGVMEEKGRQKKRPFLSQLLPGNTFVPGAFIQSQSVDQEDGQLTGTGDQKFREEAETKKNRVSWDVEMSCFLNGEATNRLRETISKNRLWPVEIMRSSSGAKVQPDENPEISFHGVAFVDMGRLLFPGATRIKGAYLIEPFSETLLSNKTKRSVSVLREHVRAVAAAARASSATAGGKKAAGNKPSNKKSEVVKIEGADGATEMVTEAQPVVNTQGNLYLDAKTYIIIEISLKKPLVLKTSPMELYRRVITLIPPKPLVSPGPTKAELAVQNYHKQIFNINKQVSDQVEKLLKEGRTLEDISHDQMKVVLMGELNMSGRYFAFKEQLKHAVVKIVRDKMQRTEPITDQQELQEFVSQLYVYLVDEMHAAMNTMKTETEEVEEEEKPDLSPQQLRHFAQEAQSTGDYDQALHYYLELLARYPSDPLSAFDLGQHYMLLGDHIKAKEFFYEAVATDQSHQPSLIMCGVLAMMFEHYKDAITFLEQAASIKPLGVVAWTLRGLLYQSQEDVIMCEWAFLEANKLLNAKQKQVLKHWAALLMKKQDHKKEEVTVAPPPQPTDEHRNQQESENENGRSSLEVKSPTETVQRASIYIETVKFLLSTYTLQLVERALSQELLSPDGGRTLGYLLHLSHLHLLREDYCTALHSLEEALALSDENTEAWALKGHCQFLSGSFTDALQSYRCCLIFKPPPSDLHLVLVRLGYIYLQQKQFDQAQLTYLQACEQSPSCLSWLGLGEASYRLGELGLAENALTQANHLNSQNGKVWAFLSLTCLKNGRLEEAEDCYKYAQRFKVKDKQLIKEHTKLHNQARLSQLSSCLHQCKK